MIPMIHTSVPDTYHDQTVIHHCDHFKKPKSNTSLQFIFTDNYPYLRSLYFSHKLRPSTFKNIQMAILCSTIYLGFDIYECPHCHNQAYIPHTCKSRLCNSCGSLYAKHRAAHVASKSVDAPHRHIVFTIPQQLRRLFLVDRHLLDLLLLLLVIPLLVFSMIALIVNIKEK